MVKLWPYSTMTQRALLLVKKEMNGEAEMFLFCLLLFFTQEQDEKSANVWWLVYVYVQYIYVYASKTQRCVRAVVRGGVGGLFTQCRGLEYWAGWGPWFCTTSRQSPLLPLLIVWWTCDSGKKKKKQPQREIVCMASIINLQKNIYTFWSSGTHHQHLQICSLSRVFDQTADTKTPKMVTDMRERDYGTASVNDFILQTISDLMRHLSATT